MNHQTYEKWALSPETCSPEEKQAFNRHLSTCRSCQALAASWLQMETLIRQEPMAVPAPGFTRRFQQALAHRKEAEQRRQLRKFLLVLSSSFVFLFLAAVVYHFALHPPQDLIRQAFDLAAGVVLVYQNASVIAGILVSLAPLQLLLLVFMITGSALSGLCMLWLTGIWKFALQGEAKK